MQTIFSTAISVLNPLFPNDQRLYRFWWHYGAVCAAIVIAMSAMVWIGANLFGVYLMIGFEDAGGVDVVREYGPVFLKTVALGMGLPAVLYRAWLATRKEVPF